MRILRISSKTTLQKLRDEGKIRYSQPERKIILYDSDSIIAYIRTFFLIKTVSVEDRISLLKRLLAENDEFARFAIKSVNEYFQDDVSKMGDQSLYYMFEMMKASLYVKPSDSQGQFSEQSNAVSNFDGRLVILANIALRLSTYLIVAYIWQEPVYAIGYYVISAIACLLIGMFLGSKANSRAEGYRLVVAHFSSPYISRP